MQASRPRRLHTPVAIKLPSITPAVNLAPESKQTAAGKPTGYHMTPPIFVRQVRLVRLKRHAVRRLHTPVAIKLPSITHW